MRTIITIFVIFLIRCQYVRAESNPGRKEIGEFFNSDSCIFGVKSISPFLYNSVSQGTTIVKAENMCNNVNSTTKVAFIIHGFISSTKTTSMTTLATRLTEKGYTVIAIDWSQGACTEGIPLVKFTEYPSAVQNVQDIGQFVGRRIESMVKNCSVPLQNIIIIGHSLGAHVSGFAAKEIQKNLNDTIPLIIAADPAKPLFSLKKCDKRLCKTDAKKVNVIHTSTLGISYPVGHLDLQVRNGWLQPGCGVNIACSHTRSIDYISDMIINCGFPGVPITRKINLYERNPPYPSPDTTKCILMNDNILDSDNPIQGHYYVFLNENEPYCTRKSFSCRQ